MSCRKAKLSVKQKSSGARGETADNLQQALWLTRLYIERPHIAVSHHVDKLKMVFDMTFFLRSRS